MAAKPVRCAALSVTLASAMAESDYWISLINGPLCFIMGPVICPSARFALGDAAPLRSLAIFLPTALRPLTTVLLRRYTALFDNSKALLSSPSLLTRRASRSCVMCYPHLKAQIQVGSRDSQPGRCGLHWDFEPAEPNASRASYSLCS